MKAISCKKIKDAGVAGIINYEVVQIAFWGTSIPFCIFAHYQVTGHWPDLSNAEDREARCRSLRLPQSGSPCHPTAHCSALDDAEGANDIVDRYRGTSSDVV